MRRHAIALGCVLGLVPTVARADAPADAVALFEQGIKDLQAGNTDVACRELAASLSKYVDSGTQGALAECYTKLGKVASAWNLWKVLADTAPPELRADAATNAAQLEPRLPRYVIKLAAGAPADLAVTINGAKVADPTLAVPLPVDPGPFTATATAKQFKPWTQSFQASEGKVVTVEVPALVALPPPPPEPTPTPMLITGAVPVAGPPARLVEGDSAARHSRHVLGGTTMLVGVAALGVGGYFGLTARSKWNDAKDICMGPVDSCPPQFVAPSQDKIDAARSAALISTVTSAAGGAAVVVGAILWLTAPAAEHRVVVSPTIGLHSSGLALSGSF